ncbi:MAG: HPr(Ser) kinase/phosphatase [Gemmatimonadetes bacterium]|nr:MAG: HPr(Ser) kinase/phosphatase [Gemmatimonadota bacterium]
MINYEASDSPSAFFANVEQEEVFTVGDMYNRWGNTLKLRLLTNQGGLKKRIVNSELDRPGLALSGYIERFAYRRIQILGQTEMSFLYSLPPEKQRQAVYNIVRFPAVPCIIVCKKLHVPSKILEVANSQGTAILQSELSTVDLQDQLQKHLEFIFAKQILIHGAMVDVYGVGMLITGDAGVGKSECALDLVERGHRFVADDVVVVKKLQLNTVTAFANSRIKHYMEIRGLGIINVKDLFGIWAVRTQKDVDIVMNLFRWDGMSNMDRANVDHKVQMILDVPIRKISIPVTSGKNMTVISEVIAMNFLREKIEGISTSDEFSKNLTRNMEHQRAMQW